MSWRSIIKISLDDAKKLTEEYAPEELIKPRTEISVRNYLKGIENRLLEIDKKGITNKPYLKGIEQLRSLIDYDGTLYFNWDDTQKEIVMYDPIRIPPNSEPTPISPQETFSLIIKAAKRLYYMFWMRFAGDMA